MSKREMADAALLERCAKVAESNAEAYASKDWKDACAACAGLIRALAKRTRVECDK